MKTSTRIILKSLADLPGVIHSYTADESREGNGLTQSGAAGTSPSAPTRTAADGPSPLLLAWGELGAARKLAAWRRGGINE